MNFFWSSFWLFRDRLLLTFGTSTMHTFWPHKKQKSFSPVKHFDEIRIKVVKTLATFCPLGTSNSPLNRFLQVILFYDRKELISDLYGKKDTLLSLFLVISTFMTTLSKQYIQVFEVGVFSFFYKKSIFIKSYQLFWLLGNRIAI